jgi:hypothetical protein
MKIEFEVEKVFTYKIMQVELTPAQVSKIRKQADIHSLSFQEAFEIYGSITGVFFEIMHGVDEDDYEYNVYGTKIVGDF